MNVASNGSRRNMQTLARPADTLLIGWIDSLRFTRECLVLAISETQPLFNILQFETAQDCIKHADTVFDLIVYHSYGPNKVDFETIKLLRAAFESARLIVLSDAVTTEPAVIRKLLELGATGFVQAGRTGLQLAISAISFVNSGGIFAPHEALSVDQPPSGPPPFKASDPTSSTPLTPRELVVLGLLKMGKTNKTIARELGLSESTVKVHVRQIMLKMGVANRTQAALNADKL